MRNSVPLIYTLLKESERNLKLCKYNTNVVVRVLCKISNYLGHSRVFMNEKKQQKKKKADNEEQGYRIHKWFWMPDKLIF